MNKKLPEWIYEPMPKSLTKCATISWDDNTQSFKILHPNQKLPEFFSKIEEAYDHVENVLNLQVIFDSSVNGHGGELSHSMFFCETPKDKLSKRLLISHTDEDKLELLQSCMESFQKLNEEYLKNQNDWVLAFNWLEQHPVFWTYHSNFHWETDNGLRGLWSSVWRESPEDDAVILFEHGSHVEPEYKEHYHDIRLDVKAKTLEKAYIKLAKKVNKIFDSFGVERPDAPKPL